LEVESCIGQKASSKGLCARGREATIFCAKAGCGNAYFYRNTDP
jgi:hypothetical protein